MGKTKGAGTGASTGEEQERAERLLRIRRCEEELQILRNLPADQVSGWVAARRQKKKAESVKEEERRKAQMETNPAQRTFVLMSSQPITQERVRVREQAARFEKDVARGVYAPGSRSDFPSDIELEPLPKRREPGAIRLTDLQQRMLAKTQKRQEEEEASEERKRTELLAATETMSPRHRSKLRRALGKGKSAAQKRYQRLLQLRHKASSLLSMRQARQAHGIDSRALEERQRLLQETRALRKKLLDPESLESVREKCRGKSTLSVDSELLPLPAGVHLENARVAHLQSLAVVRQGKEWWRAVRKGEERDVRTCFDSEPCWEGWKNASRLLDKKTFLYGRSAPPSPKSDGARANQGSPGSAKSARETATSGIDPFTGKKWFVEPALSAKSCELSDWWLNYALGALAESSEAELAIQEAREATKQGHKSFASVLDRQTRKIVDYYRQQIVYEREDYDRQERLAEAERTRLDEDDTFNNTVIEQSLAATMAALEAPLGTEKMTRSGLGRDRERQRARRSHSAFLRKQSDNEGVPDSHDEYISDLEPDVNDDVTRTTPSPAPVSPISGRRTKSRSRLGNKFVPDAGRKTMFDDSIGSPTASMDFDHEENIADAAEGRKTQRESSQKRGNRRIARSSRGRRTSFMALETIRGTYDDIIQAPNSNDGELLVDDKAKTMPDMSTRVNEAEEGLREKSIGQATPPDSSRKDKKHGKHQRSVTVGAGTQLAVGKRQQETSTGTESEDSRPSLGKLSPGGEVKTARSLLSSLFTNVSFALQQNGISVHEFLAEKFDGAESLKYAEFMEVLLNLDNNLPDDKRIGLDSMSKARLSAIFKILEDENACVIPLLRVQQFIDQLSGSRKDGGDAGGDKSRHDASHSPDAPNDAENVAHKRAFSRAIKAIVKGARWTARSSGESDNIMDTILSVFEEKDGDATGRVTQGMFAKAMRQLGVEITREQLDVLLEDLGASEDSKPKDRVIDYRRLISHVRKFMEVAS